jgi:hypothetical protein
MKCTSHESCVSHILSIPVMEVMIILESVGFERKFTKSSKIFLSRVNCGKILPYTQIVDLLISCFHCIANKQTSLRSNERMMVKGKEIPLKTSIYFCFTDCWIFWVNYFRKFNFLWFFR